MSEKNKINYEVKMENAVVRAVVDLQIDIIDVLKEQAAKTDNTVDDSLIKLMELARDNADWKGYAKEHIL